MLHTSLPTIEAIIFKNIDTLLMQNILFTEIHYSLCPLRSCKARWNSWQPYIGWCQLLCNSYDTYCEGYEVRGNQCYVKLKGGCRETIQPSQDTHLYLKGSQIL